MISAKEPVNPIISKTMPHGHDGDAIFFPDGNAFYHSEGKSQPKTICSGWNSVAKICLVRGGKKVILFHNKTYYEYYLPADEEFLCLVTPKVAICE